MEEEGTYQYIQNLAAFTSRTECHFNKVVKPRNLAFRLNKNYKPSSKFYRNIFLIDSQKYISNMKQIYYFIKLTYYTGDIIYISNSRNYKISLDYLSKMRYFNPDFSFDNNIILRELLSPFMMDSYKAIYVIDSGEQIREESKFGDLILINKTLRNKYKIFHMSLNYDDSYFSKNEIRAILNRINNYNSFSNSFIKLRNYVYSSNEFFYNIEDDEEDEEEETGFNLIINKISDLLDNNIHEFNNGIGFYNKKLAILLWRFNCGRSNLKKPTAANKDSK